jgi:hypothetical protein
MQIRIIDSHLSLPYLRHFKTGKHFIETGTYRGDTIYVAKEAGFEQISSCEIYDPLFLYTQNLFSHDSSITIYKQESPEFIEYLIGTGKITEPSTFWLDAHASGPLNGGKSVGSPILDELREIAKGNIKDHTILIDDRRLFGSSEWGGVTEKEALDILMQINPKYNIFNLDGVVPGDILCATIKEAFKNE